MNCRRLAPRDWRRFRDIRLEMLREPAGAFESSHAEWAAKSEDEIRSWLERIHVFGLFDGGRLAGCAGFATGGDRRAEVVAAFLRPEWRGKGHMALITARLAEAARAEGLARLHLRVAAWNAPARAAFARAGFVPVATHDDAGGPDGPGGIVMVLELPAP